MHISIAMDWIVSPTNSYVKALTPNIMYLEIGPYLIGFDEVIRMEP